MIFNALAHCSEESFFLKELIIPIEKRIPKKSIAEPPLHRYMTIHVFFPFIFIESLSPPSTQYHLCLVLVSIMKQICHFLPY